jgi:chemotaxis protein MotA
MLVIVGYTIIILSVFGGFVLSGGHLLALFQPLEMLMIFGAALGSFVVGNNRKVIKASFKAWLSTFKGAHYSKQFYVELLSLFYEITNKIRKDGVLSIEGDIENYKESPLFSKYLLIQKEPVIMEFICDHLRLIITGRVDIADLESIMDCDIETLESEGELPANAINKVADGMPAFGIVAAVMGVVHTMESIGGVPPSELGKMIAEALVGTFMGVLIGYGFIAPIGAILETRVQGRIKILQAIKVVLIASTNNLAPTIAVEFARKVLYSDERPNSKELEVILQDVKSNKVKEANV